MAHRHKSIILALSVILSAGFIASAQTEYKDIFDMIRGKVPGVQVGTASAGQMPSIIIRGIGTNSDQTQPLILVDGVQTPNITYLEPKDVYEIDIIKDGTASIYGAQGANGVILITTRSSVEAAQLQAEAKKTARLARKASRKNNKQ